MGHGCFKLTCITVISHFVYIQSCNFDGWLEMVEILVITKGTIFCRGGPSVVTMDSPGGGGGWGMTVCNTMDG